MAPAPEPGDAPPPVPRRTATADPDSVGSVGSAGVTALLLLADGRFPAGGHAHSAGVEAAVADGRIHDHASLHDFVTGRLRTAGLVDAALAAATVLALHEPGAPPSELGGSRHGLRGDVVAGATRPPPAPGVADDRSVALVLDRLDQEAAARIVAPPLRTASRRLGRQLLRVAGRCWPGPLIDAAVAVRPDGIHNPVALGVVVAATGLSARDAAAVIVHHTVTTPAQAAVRLLGLDPFEVAALTARVDRVAAEVVDRAVAAALDAVGCPSALPAAAAPLIEIAAMDHQAADLRLFAT